jgi:hypothetical protein
MHILSKQILRIRKQFFWLVIVGLFLSFLNLCTTYAQVVPSFDSNLLLQDYDLYSLSRTTDIYATGSYTGTLDSKEKVESFLCSRGSVLCGTTITANLYSFGGVYYLNQLSNLTFEPGNGYRSIENTNMLVSEAIWRLTRTNLVQGCLDSTSSSCFDNSAAPINPGFLLAFIQKEETLINGTCAQVNADSNGCAMDNLAFRKDRATGYFCFETSDKSNTCYDENPNWVIYKGLFKQMYHAMRRIKVLQTSCRLGGGYSFKNSNGDFTVGKNVTLDGNGVTLKNDITCALYIYTPHIPTKNVNTTSICNYSGLWGVMCGYAVISSIEERYGINSSYSPVNMVI